MAVWERAGLFGFFGLLALYTLSTGDGGGIAPWMISAAMLLLIAGAVALAPTRPAFPLPVICLLLMTLYGVVQTLFFPQKITARGWQGVLFWLTAAAIAGFAGQLFADSRAANVFRDCLAAFGTAVCLLDLLQQASYTNRYFWMAPSRYPAIFGPFAYWNNFAQFVELVLPVTLWKALGEPRVSIPLLVCAALQVGAAVASGSRAGAALVMAELLAVIVIAFRRRRDRALLAGAVLAVVFSSVFIYAAGYRAVVRKLERSDQLAVRRNINLSSLAMIRERPLTGWGLETYVPVYRMFALYDDGNYVNRAHNDWLQWAAEGGVFFAGAMLVVALWSFRPAVRSGWGLGLVAIALHALVDYPFARLGVCGWYFCLLGMSAGSGAGKARPSTAR